MIASDQAHPDPADLEAFGLGRLDAARTAAVEAHVLGCDACAKALQQTPNDTWVDHFLKAATIDYWPAAATADVEAPTELVAHPRYRLLKLLGRGGMGAVYLAEHGVMQRRVALKIIKPEYTANVSAVERFRREIRAAAQLHHPNIVAAYDAEQVGETHILVMEYIDGVSLDRVVAERGPLPVAEACEHVRQAALGLQHAHEQGMVHRDVKPHNLIRGADGVVKVLDFGLASVGVQGEGQLTGPNVVMGTPDYIAPEQAEDTHTADARADIYALGCVLYFLLTGGPPFARPSTLRTLLAHRDESPPPLSAARPDVPAGLADVLGRMMAKAPADRYPTAAEVAVALASFTETIGRPSLHDGPATRGASRPPRRRLLVAGAAAALLIGLLAAAVVVHIQTDQGETTIETNDPNIELVVQKGGKLVRIVDPQSKQTWELDPEKYQLSIADRPDGLTIALDGKAPFTLMRKGEKLVTITRGPSPAVGQGAKPPTDDKPAVPKELEVARRLSWPGRYPNPATTFSSDGRLCAGFGRDAIRVWEVETGQRVQDITGLPEIVTVVFLPDGKQLLSSHSDGRFFRWDLATGKQLSELEGPVGWNLIGGVAPDGDRFCWFNGQVHVWDVESGKERVRIEPTGQGAVLLASHKFSPDGRRLLTADLLGEKGGGILRIFDAKSGDLIHSIASNLAPDTLTWGEDGRHIYVNAGDPDLKAIVIACWNADTGKSTSKVRLTPELSSTFGRCFSRDAHWLAVQYPDKALFHLYETDGGTLVGRASGPNAPFSCSFSPVGSYAACGQTGEVILYRLPALPGGKDKP